MSAIICLVASPVAALTIWGLLRSPVAARFVATPSGDRWHARATPTLGGVGIFAGFAVAVLLAVAARAVGGSSELFGILGGAAIVFAAGPARRSPLAARARQAGRAGRRRGTSSSRPACASRSSPTACSQPLLGGLWLVGMTNAFNLLDNMDGLAGSLAVVAATFFAIDAVYLHKESLLLVLSLSIGLRGARLPALQLPPAQAGGGVHGRLGQPGARVRARRARPGDELEGGRVDRRDAAPAAARPRRADPRHGARHHGPRRRGAVDRPGRPGPHVAPTRPRRASARRAPSSC